VLYVTTSYEDEGFASLPVERFYFLGKWQEEFPQSKFQQSALTSCSIWHCPALVDSCDAFLITKCTGSANAGRNAAAGLEKNHQKFRASKVRFKKLIHLEMKDDSAGKRHSHCYSSDNPGR